jgi:RHS repeat-associated protein
MKSRAAQNLRLLVLFLFFTVPSIWASAVGDLESCRKAGEQEDWKLAISLCTGSISSGELEKNGLSSAYSYRGFANNRLGRHRNAIVDLGAALKLDQDNPNLLLTRGKSHAMLGRYHEAIRDFSRVIQLDLGSRPAYDLRGNSYSELGEFRKAIADFDRAIELDSKSASAFNNRGLTFMEMGDLDRAITDLNRSLKLEPGNENAKHNLQLIHARKGESARNGTPASQPPRRIIKQQPTALKIHTKNQRQSQSITGDQRLVPAARPQVLAIPENASFVDVDMESASLIVSATDIVLQSGAAQIEIRRSLTQSVPMSGVFGANWRMNWEGGLNREDRVVLIERGPETKLFTAGGDDNVFTNGVGERIELGADGFALYLKTNGGRERFDPAGRLVQTYLRNGNRFTLNYDTASRLQRIQGPAGSYATFQWDDGGRITSIKGSKGDLVEYRYENDLLIEVRLNGKQLHTYGYTKKKLLARITDAYDRVSEIRYDEKGRVNRRSWPGGGADLLSYDDDNQRITKTDRTGGVTTLEFSKDGLRYKVTDVLGNNHLYSHDKNGRITSHTGPDGTKTGLEYDHIGRMTSISTANNQSLRLSYLGVFSMPSKISYPDGTQERFVYDHGLNLTTVMRDGDSRIKYVYEKGGRIRSLSDGAGATISFGYDSSGNLVRETTPLQGEIRREYDQFNRMIAVTDERGGRTRISYAPDGHQASSISYPDGSTLHYRYDSSKRLSEAIDADGEVTRYEYDQAGRLAHESRPGLLPLTYTYDAANNILEIRENGISLVRFKRDLYGRILSETHSGGLEIIYKYDAKGNLESWGDNTGAGGRMGYDAKGRPQWSIDPIGNRHSFEYDAANHLIAMDDPVGNRTRTSYTKHGQLKQLSNALGHSASYSYNQAGMLQQIETSSQAKLGFSYDVAGNLLTSTDPLGRTLNHAYDRAGQLISSKDAAGKVIRYRYDLDGRLLEKLLPENRSIRYRYDDAGHLLSMDDGAFPINYEYGRFGRLAGIAYPVLGVNLKYRYGSEGRVAGFTGPEGKETVYEYDVSGRMQSMRLPGGGLIKFEFDPRERLVSVEYPNGMRATREYDALGNTKGVAYLTASGQVVKSWSYTYDGTGNLAETRDEAGKKTRFGHDAGGQVIEEHSAGKPSIKYSYGPGGNRRRLTMDERIISYRYDKADQILRAGEERFKHDASGNLTERSRDGSATRYSYSVEGLLMAVNLPGGKQVRFGYSPSGERIWREGVKGKIHYVTDGTHLIATLDQDRQLATRFYHGPGIDQPVAMLHDGKLYYYLLDGLGSVAALVDAEGKLAASYATDAYGKLKQSSGTLPNPFIFTGREFDPDTGLYYYRARYYDPKLGRFLTRDPIGPDLEDLASLNPYLYVRNSPLMLTDPWGLTSTPTNVHPVTPAQGHTQPYSVPGVGRMHGATRAFQAPGVAPSNTPTSQTPAPPYAIGPLSPTRDVHLVNTRPSPAPSLPSQGQTQPYQAPSIGRMHGQTRPNVAPGAGPVGNPTVAAPRPGFWNPKYGYRQARDWYKQMQHKKKPGMTIFSTSTMAANTVQGIHDCMVNARTEQQRNNCIGGVLAVTSVQVLGAAGATVLVYFVPAVGPPIAIAGTLIGGAWSIIKVGDESINWIRDKYRWKKAKENSEYLQDQLGKKDQQGKTFLDKLIASVKKKIEEIRKLALQLRDAQQQLERGWQSVQAEGKKGDAELKAIEISLAKIEQLVKICQQHKQHLNTIVDTARQEVERHLQIIEKASDRLIELAAAVPPAIAKAEELAIRIGELSKALDEKKNAVLKMLRQLDLSFTATAVRYPIRFGPWVTHSEQYKTREMKGLRRSIATLDRMVTGVAKVPGIYWPPKKYVEKFKDVAARLIKAREDAIAKLDRARELAKLCDIDIEARIQLTKKASSGDVLKDDEVVYTYTVKNIGNAILNQVNVSDDKCQPVTRTHGDDHLDPDETWSFDCSATLTATTSNTANATAIDPNGKTVRSGPQSVTVKVSTDKVKVPYLLGLTRDAASYDVEQVGLKPNAQDEYGPLPKGDVFKQQPQPETVVKKRSRVDFWISKGPAPKVRTLYLDPPMQKIGIDEVAGIRALLVFENGDEEDVTRMVSWSWYPDTALQKAAPGRFVGRDKGRVVVTAREKRGTGVASITVDEESRTKWDKPISHADELTAKALPPPPDAFTWYALCDMRSGDVRYGEDVNPTRYKVLGGAFQGPRDAKLWVKQNYPDWRCTGASTRHGKWNALCNKKNLSVGIGKGVDPTRFWIMRGGFLGEKDARSWVRQNCPGWQCTEGGACSDQRRGGAWSVVCSKKHGGFGLSKRADNIGYWIFADGFFGEPDARRWVERNCPSWRCNRDGQCMPGRRVSRDKPLELPPEAKAGQYGDWRSGRSTQPGSTTEKSMGSPWSGNWSGSWVEEAPGIVRCSYSVSLSLDGSRRGQLRGRLTSEMLIDQDLKGMGQVCPRSLNARASLSVSGNRIKLNTGGKSIPLVTSSKNRLSCSRTPVGDGVISISLRKR